MFAHLRSQSIVPTLHNIVLSHFFVKLELPLCSWFVESLIDETKKDKDLLVFLNG